MKCELCEQEYVDSMDGLVEMSLHRIIRHGK